MDFLIGRQAILNRNGKTFGYELLYRDDSIHTTASFNDGNLATSRVIVNAFINVGLNRIAQFGRVFINFTKDLIIDRVYESLPKNRVVVEVLEDVMAEKEVVESLMHAKELGYTIALDDFVFLDHLEELVKLADIIKVDFRELSEADIKQQVELYKPYNLKLLAEKVESTKEFEQGLNLGFEYFQGYFFQKPTIEIRKDIAPNKVTLIKALATINDPNSDIENLITIISGDLYLHTKLLAFVNSPLFGLKSKIHTIKSAASMLGFERLKEWLNIMYASKLAEDKPEELVIASSIRAKFAQLLAEYFNVDEDKAYLMGMISLMDAILEMPMRRVLKDFDYLDKEIISALVGRNNSYKELLNLIVMFERYDVDNIQIALDKLSLDIGIANQMYFDAIAFAENVYRS